ncbi:peptide-binding protein [Sutcliffiella cohnii]
MKLKQKSLLFIVLALVLSMFLAACSGSTGGNENNNTNNTDNATNDTGNNTGDDEEEEADSNEPVYGGNLVLGSTGSPTLFNGYYSSDTASSAIEGFIFDSLLGSDTGFEPTLSMAKDWQQSDDFMVHTFELKDGLKFHDGEPVTAEDVVFSLSIPLHEDYDGPRKGYFEGIESIEATDENTIVVTLNKVKPDIHITFGFPILPKHILGDVPVAELGEHEFNTKNPVGSGPFVFDEWADGQYVRVKAFDDYHEGRPYLDTLTYKIVPDADGLLTQLATGDIDFYTVPASDYHTVLEWEEAGDLKIASGLALSYTFLGYNLRNDLFKEKEVRQALTHAIDREAIVASIMAGDGEVAHVPESPLSWAYDENVPKFDYDVDKAKQMLEEAGWTPGADGILEKDGQKFSFSLKTNQGNKIREDIAVVVQEQFAQIGIEVKPEIMEWSAFLADVNPPAWNFDAIILGWSLGIDPDPSGIFHSKEIEEGLNFVAYSNPEADELMDLNMSTMDRDERAEYIKQANAMIAEDQPYTFLYYPNAHRAMPVNLEGFEFHAKNEFYNIHKWWLKQ